MTEAIIERKVAVALALELVDYLGGKANPDEKVRAMPLGFFSRVGCIIFPIFFVHQKKTWPRAAETKEIIRVLVLLIGAITLGTGVAFPLSAPDAYSEGVVTRGLDVEDLDMRIEAFTADGLSLGYRDNCTWTNEDVEFGNSTTNLAYHPNASY